MTAVAVRAAAPPGFGLSLRAAVAHERVVVGRRVSFALGLAASVAVAVIVGAAMGAAMLSIIQGGGSADIVDAVMIGTGPARILVVVLGAVAITSDWANGQLASATLAVPRRGALLVGKGLVVAGGAAVAGILTGSALVGVAALEAQSGGVEIHIGVRVVGVVLSCGLQYAAVALIGLGIGALLRGTAAAVSAAIGLFMVLPVLVATLPQVQPYLPHSSLSALTVMDADGAAGAMPWVAALLVTALWVAAAVGGGLWSFSRADL